MHDWYFMVRELHNYMAIRFPEWILFFLIGCAVANFIHWYNNKGE